MTQIAVHREMDARSLNFILGDKDVAPFVSGGGDAAIGNVDLSAVVKNPANVNLIGEFGGLLAVQIAPGIYEVHTHVLRKGRGQWALGMVRSALHHLFTHTDAVEILTKVPKGNLAARALVRLVHGVYDFTAPSGWTSNGVIVPAGVYGLTIQEWARQTPAIEERGQWFYKRLSEELLAQGFQGGYDPAEVEKMGAARAIGLAYDMIIGGQFGKAEAFYRRWGFMTGAPPIEILMQGRPATVKFGDVLLIVRSDDIWVPTVQAAHTTLQ